MDATTPLYELASSYWASSTLDAALELGVFPPLIHEACTAPELAARLNCNPGTLNALLDALAGLGLLRREAAGYTVSPERAPFLDPDSPDYLGGAFAFNRDLQGLWRRLPDCVRSGEPVMPASPHLGQDPDRTRRFVEGMHSRAAVMARGLLQVVEPEPGSRILDLAGGPGTFSVRLLERDPSLSIIVFDLPPIVRAARDIHAGNPFGTSLTFQGGDYHQDALPGNQDLLLYCGALHQEVPDALPGLLARMKAALNPEGRLLLVDLFLNEDRATPLYAALFDLNMRLMRPSSHVHTVAGVEAALEPAGLTLVRSGDVPETPYRFVEAALA